MRQPAARVTHISLDVSISMGLRPVTDWLRGTEEESSMELENLSRIGASRLETVMWPKLKER